MPAAKSEPLADLAAAAVAENPELRDRILRVFNALLNDVEHQIKWGTPAERAALARSFVPALLRSMASADANAAEKQQAEAYERIKAAMRGQK